MADESVQTVNQDSPYWKWVQDFGSDFAQNTAIRYAGKGLKMVPGGKWLGNIADAWGRFGQLYAAPNATLHSIERAKGWDTEATPQTWGGHAKKWLRNAGTEAAIGMGMQGAGLLVSAIPTPWTVAGGRLLSGAGKMVTGYSAANATFGTAADMLGNHIQRKMDEKAAQQQRIQDMRDRYARNAQYSSMLGAGMAGLAGLGGAHLLINAIPAIKRRRYLKYLAYALAAGGAGYAGWKYTNNQQNKYKVI
jgi:hypothetical protein